jgi:hypothetical protein
VASGRDGFSSHALFELLAAEVDFAGAIDGVRSFWFREPSLIKWGQVSRVYAALCWRSSRWETRVRRPLRSRLEIGGGRQTCTDDTDAAQSNCNDTDSFFLRNLR